jgi:GT2 family glycosyltransferase/glycosyltransferase involved in cell wall biosynthesis
MTNDAPRLELPLVVAVVLNWNGWRDTLRCLDSLNGVEYPRLSVLVVDNHSTDDSVALLRNAHPDLEILVAGRNGGYAAGMNLGIARAFELGADWIWALNNDIVMRPDALQASVTAIVGPDVGVVGSTQVTSATPWVSARPYPTAARHRGRRDEMVVCMGEPPHLQGHDVDFVSGAALLLRSEMLRQVGQLDESYFHYAEEVDLCERARLAGWKSVLACASRIWHAQGGSLALRAPEATYYRVRNQLRLERRLYGRGVASTLVYRPRLALDFLTRALDRYPAPGAQARAVFQGILDGHLGRTGPLSTHRSAHSSTNRGVSGRVRVLFVGHSAQLAGAEQSLLRLLARLNRERFEPIVLLPETGPFEDRARDVGVRTVRARYSWWIANRNGPLGFFARFWWSVLNMPALIRTARTVKPDIIYTNSLVVPQGAFLAKFLGVPHIWHVCELLSHPTLNTPLSRDFVLSLVVRLSSSVVVVSESSGRQFDGTRGARVRVIYNGVEQLTEVDRDQDRARRMADGAIRLAVVGTLSRAKRTLDAIKAVEILRESFPAVHLAVVGGGIAAYERSVKRYVASHGLEGNVDLLGQREDVLRILSESDLLLMPAWPEAFGLVTVEALSVGTPVVGASTTGTAEILSHGGGILVEPGRPELIADAVRQLVSTPEIYIDARRQAHSAARAFSIEREVKLIEQEIIRVLRGRHEN